MKIDELSIGQLVEYIDGYVFRVEHINRRDGAAGLQTPDGDGEVWTFEADELERAFRPYWPDTIDRECGGD